MQYVNKHDSQIFRIVFSLAVAVSLCLCRTWGQDVAALMVSGDDGDGDERVGWSAFMERMTDENDDGAIDAELVEQLEQLHAAPLNINTATADELLQLPFISREQADDIVNFRQKNGALYSLGELMMIRSLSKSDRDMLRLFVTAGEPAPADRDGTHGGRKPGAAYGHEVVWRTDIPLYTKAGFAHYPDSVLRRSPNKVYLGDRFYHSLRYKATCGRHFSAGVQMEKDAGESGVDYLSGYAMVRDWGVVSRAVVGDYRVSFGQGLVVNTSARFGKMMMLANVSKPDAGVRPHSSTTESGYMTGAAVTLRLGQVELSAFVSQRKADGTMRNDSLGLTSLKTDGLHRTRLERSKDGILTISNIGGNVRWSSNGASVSATVLTTSLSVPLAPSHDTKSTLYRRYNPQGTSFTNAGVAYMWRRNRLTFSGETAVSNAQGFHNPTTGDATGRQSGLATLNTLKWRVGSRNTLTAIGRWYGAKHVSLFGNAFGSNDSPQNEEGVLVGWNSQIVGSIKATVYADFMYFPWMKYRVPHDSRAVETLAQLEYSTRSRSSLMLRYRMKDKRQLGVAHNLKLQHNLRISRPLVLRSTVAANVSRLPDKEPQRGLAVTEAVGWQPLRSKTKIDAGLTYFNTSSYDSRIYQYEPSLLYSYGFTSYYYHGLRSLLLATVPVARCGLYVTAKLGYTLYINREQIGTGLELIDASHRQDVQLQVRWKL